MNGAEDSLTAEFMGTFHQKVDDKRRLQIPARWRPHNLNIELILVIWTKYQAGACVRVLPPETMNKVKEEIESIPDKKQKAAIKRLMYSNSIRVPIDKANRICIPESFALEARIDKEAVLVGAGDRFEIWNRDRFKEVTEETAEDLRLAMEYLE